MTYSESKFREHLKKVFNDPKIYIHKLPDMKQGVMNNVGMPDYIVICKGQTMWFEVKTSPTKKTFNLNLISESQYIEFDKMHNAGATIYIAIYIDKVLYMVPYLNIRSSKFLTNEVSISIDTLTKWRVQWKL